MKRIIYIVLTAVVMAGCSDYQKLLKSHDPDLKYEKALEYFNAGKYSRSLTLLEDVSPYYKGTERAQEVITYLARSYLGQKQYTSAANYYEAYLRNYPKGRYAIEARFHIGHCYYMDAPDARLDQTDTKKAITAFEQFVELYPESPYAEQAYKEMFELYDRLAYKELLNAKLYYNLGTYLGNNYLSCEITAKNALKNYPNNSYREALSWYVLAAKYQQLMNSVDSKRRDRARETEDEYYNFKTDYPESKHLKEADKMEKEIRKILDK